MRLEMPMLCATLSSKSELASPPRTAFTLEARKPGGPKYEHSQEILSLQKSLTLIVLSTSKLTQERRQVCCAAACQRRKKRKTMNVFQTPAYSLP